MGSRRSRKAALIVEGQSLLAQIEQLAKLHGGEIAAGEASRQNAALHIAGIMVELHGEERGRDPRLLSRRLVLPGERADAEEAKPEQEQRHRNRQHAPERQEARRTQQHRCG